MRRKARNPEQARKTKHRWFVRGLGQALKPSRSQPAPKTSSRPSAAIPATFRDAAYQLGVDVTWLATFQREGWVYEDENFDTNVHVALDSILSCVDILKRYFRTSDRTNSIEQIVEDARQEWLGSFASRSHHRTIRRACEGATQQTADATIRVVAQLAPLSTRCEKLDSAVSALGSDLGMEILKLIDLGRTVASCADEVIGKASPADARQRLHSLAQQLTKHNLPGIANEILEAAQLCSDDDIWIYARGIVFAAHNQIRSHLAGRIARSKKAREYRQQTARHIKVLVILYEQEAFDADHALTRADVAFRAKMGNEDSFSQEIAELRRWQLTEVKPGPGGGSYLTEAGKKKTAMYLNDKRTSSNE